MKTSPTCSPQPWELHCKKRLAIFTSPANLFYSVNSEPRHTVLGNLRSENSQQPKVLDCHQIDFCKFHLWSNITDDLKSWPPSLLFSEMVEEGRMSNSSRYKSCARHGQKTSAQTPANERKGRPADHLIKKLYKLR
jgi:hypothetical protein